MTDYNFSILVCPYKHFQNVSSLQPCQRCGSNTEVVENVKCVCIKNTFRFANEKDDNTKNCYCKYFNASDLIINNCRDVRRALANI